MKRQRIEEGVRRAADGAAAPQKKYFRTRAHINPLAFTAAYRYPISHERMDWSGHFPAYTEGLTMATQEDDNAKAPEGVVVVPKRRRARHVEVLDIGCGFGGLMMGLGPALPDTLMMGLEIRSKVTEYVRLRIMAQRRLESKYHNASVMCTNAMKYLPNLYPKGSLSKMFFCFPDPHFKRSNHRRRIVTTELLAEYAYFLKEGEGILYTISDVLDLHNWMAAHADAHPAFKRLTDEELAADPCVPIMRTYTEEGQKVERNKGAKYIAVFRRVSHAEAEAKAAALDFWSEPVVQYEKILAERQTKNMSGAAARKAEKGGAAAQ